jgi:anti-anti-sigma factor
VSEFERPPHRDRLAAGGRAVRPFKLTEVESWPEGLEILIEGELDAGSAEEFDQSLDRALDSAHLYVMIDLDRCEFIDVAVVKLLVVAQEQLLCRGHELLIFAATGQVRRMLEVVEAFDRRVLIGAPGDAPAAHERSPAAEDGSAQTGRGWAALSRLGPWFGGASPR